MDSSSDAELVHRARRGDREAFGELIRKYQRPIYALACALLPDRLEAEDIAQEAFLRAWLNLDLLSDPAKFAPWLRRIVFGVSMDWLRAFRPDLYRLADTNAESSLLAQPAGLESALSRLERIELQQRVWDAVARLPARYRLPLTMFHLDGLSHARVGQALGVTESTVRSLVTRAREKLRPMLSSFAAELYPALEDVLREQTGGSHMLHISDGESVAGTLRQAGLPGDVRIYGDLLYEGPTPAGLSSEAWCEARARFHAAAGYATLEDARGYMQEWQRTLESSATYEEVVLWMDHRLTDQLMLLRLLDGLSRQQPRAPKISLICAGRYPGIENFIGLGELNPDQLASLADTRQPVFDAQFQVAQASWLAFTSSDPTEIERLVKSDISALPFLEKALRRHLEQFPSFQNGLSRTEHQALAALHQNGPMTAAKLFLAVQRSEELLFMGDLSFYQLLVGMASAKHPLLQTADARGLRLGKDGPALQKGADSLVMPTDTGRKVLEGHSDYVKLNGLDRWIGGVHLTGDQVAWRWDRAASKLIGPRR